MKNSDDWGLYSTYSEFLSTISTCCLNHPFTDNIQKGYTGEWVIGYQGYLDLIFLIV